MPSVTLSSQAEQDLDAIAAFLAVQSTDTALRFYDAVAATLERLSTMPRQGRPRPATNPALAELRSWRIDGFPSLLVLYIPVPDGIRVMRVMHGARDVDAELEQHPGT